MAEYDVLVQLTDVEDGRRRAFELGDRLGWEKSRLSKQVIRMEQRGLVVREACEEDRRGAYVAITAQGRKAIEDAAPRHVEVVRRLFLDPLARPQVESLAAAMAAILAQGEQPS
jgi:DNA-binding MarR family transcriptional regulator